MDRDVDVVELLTLGVEDRESGNPLSAVGGGDDSSNSQNASGLG